MAAEDAWDDEGTAQGPAHEPELAAALAYLRALEVPCAPPVGVGEFDILCVSARHVIVWYTPAREGHVAGEHAIPTPSLAAAWAALRAGQPLDEAALARIGGGAGWGRWLLAILAQLPGVAVSAEEPVRVTLTPTAPDAPEAREAAPVPDDLADGGAAREQGPHSS